MRSPALTPNTLASVVDSKVRGAPELDRCETSRPILGASNKQETSEGLK